MVLGTFGPYRVQSLIGRGGMGEVYRAHDTARGRMVALKLLPEHLAEDPLFVARFRREARLAARVSDPHLVPVHDFGEIDGRLYIDMALIEGEDLASVIEREGPLPATDAVAVLAEVAGALDTVHAAGLVHRDIKPSNVLLTAARPGRRRFAYLSDFGIARATVNSTGSDLTSSQATVGTLQYMAPERFAATGGVDHLADVYALACVLYEVVTGWRPYPDEDIPALIAAHLHRPVPRPSAVRPRLAPLDDVVATGMAKDPQQRYASAGGLAHAAERAIAARPAGRAGDAAGPAAGRPEAPLPRLGKPGPPAGVALAPPAAGWATAAGPVATRREYGAPPQPVPPLPVGQQPPAARPGRRWPIVALAGLTAALAVTLAVTLIMSGGGGGGGNSGQPPPATSTEPARPSRTSNSATVGLSIPDDVDTGITHGLRLAGSGTVRRLAVFVEIIHPLASDLRIYLISPSGYTKELILGRDVTSDGVTPISYTFASDSDNPANAESLSGFLRQPYDGEWRIKVVDAEAQDEGRLTSWSIEVVPA